MISQSLKGIDGIN